MGNRKAAIMQQNKTVNHERNACVGRLNIPVFNKSVTVEA